LLISRIDNNQYITDEVIDCSILLKEIEEELEDRLEEKEINFKLEISDKHLFTGNKTLLHIMFYNVVVNAIKFTETGGNITITDIKSNTNYGIYISDDGCGMDKEQLSNIFNRFTRLNFQKEGQGLGLAIVKSIANFHQLEIQVDSIQNKGSEFVFVFPKNKKL
jgi:signal transduction histidine kinase